MKFLKENLLQWHVGVLFGTALFLRLLLIPYPGFPGDTDVSAQYARVTSQEGLFAVSTIPTSALCPPALVYQNYLIGLLGRGKFQKTQGESLMESSVFERICVRIIPVGHDLLMGLALLLVLACYVSPRTGQWAAAIYLFNPGTLVNSSLWNYDAVPSFYILLAVCFLGIAVSDHRYTFWMLAWGTAALAFCFKLQAGMLLPVMGVITLLTWKPGAIVRSAIVFLAVVVLIYMPFLIGEQWTYLKEVFMDSFQAYSVTSANAYNLWGLWFQMPTNHQIAGITLESVGRMLYLASMAWLMWQVWKQKVAQATSADAIRRVAIVSAFGCLAPFMVLTRMHERYIAPAVALCILAGMLDRRLRPLLWGVSITYGLNLLAILIHAWLPSDLTASRGEIHFSFIIVRFFCSLLNVGLFAWLALRLPGLLSGAQSHVHLPANPLRRQPAPVIASC